MSNDPKTRPQAIGGPESVTSLADQMRYLIAMGALFIGITSVKNPVWAFIITAAAMLGHKAGSLPSKALSLSRAPAIAVRWCTAVMFGIGGVYAAKEVTPVLEKAARPGIGLLLKNIPGAQPR